ncbi:hypothetical protein ID857_21305 [Xenorhabdus sp. CUL]|nr:hypothetical protein [Xenorhabdus sp. CUL]
MIHVVLNFAAGTPANSNFSVLLNGSQVAQSANADTAGQISVIRAGIHSIGDTISIINTSANPVTIVDGTGSPTSGHSVIFRFADGPLP